MEAKAALEYLGNDMKLSKLYKIHNTIKTVEFSLRWSSKVIQYLYRLKEFQFAGHIFLMHSYYRRSCRHMLSQRPSETSLLVPKWLATNYQGFLCISVHLLTCTYFKMKYVSKSSNQCRSKEHKFFKFSSSILGGPPTCKNVSVHSFLHL